MILSAAKLNRRSKGDFKGRNSEAALIPQLFRAQPLAPSLNTRRQSLAACLPQTAL
jgi:hypothetical protein